MKRDGMGEPWLGGFVHFLDSRLNFFPTHDLFSPPGCMGNFKRFEQSLLKVKFLNRRDHFVELVTTTVVKVKTSELIFCEDFTEQEIDH